MCKSNCSYGMSCRYGNEISVPIECAVACRHPKEKTVIDGGQCALTGINFTSGEPGITNWTGLPEIELPKFFETAKDTDGLKSLIDYSLENGGLRTINDAVKIEHDRMFGKTVVIPEAQSLYRGKMDYEKWYEKNESEIDIELAENGADREMDFDREREYEKRYDKYLLTPPTVSDMAWEAWKQDQKSNPNDVDGHSFVHGYKAGYKAGPEKYTDTEVLGLIRKFLADHPLHRGMQITGMAAVKWFQENKKQ